MCHYTDKSSDHKQCNDEDMFLICYATSDEHMFKVLREFMGRSPSRCNTTLSCLVAVGQVQLEIQSIQFVT